MPVDLGGRVCNRAAKELPEGGGWSRNRTATRPPRLWARAELIRGATAKATPEETAAFGSWLMASAHSAAEAAECGGSIGFRAERVSDGEQAMLDEGQQAVSAGLTGSP
jgi:hypothetical protein